MNKAQMNLQDNFLNQVRKDNTQVTIYLVSGVQLKGFVRGFDSFTVVLETPGKPAQLVYKHAMASVVPGRPVQFQQGPREERPGSPEPAETKPSQPPVQPRAQEQEQGEES
jgi:host factor-I protein